MTHAIIQLFVRIISTLDTIYLIIAKLSNLQKKLPMNKANLHRAGAMIYYRISNGYGDYIIWAKSRKYTMGQKQKIQDGAKAENTCGGEC